MADVRIGISGWRYRGWRGDFYPEGLPQRRELEYASRRLNSIEINGSFYSLQSAESYRRWHAATPRGFLFAVKGGRFITHMKRLKDVDRPLANFFASGVLRLEDKLGPILWQLPPNFRFDAERIGAFLDLLPRDTASAARLARGHGPQVEPGQAWTATDRNRRIRHALEIRHESCFCPEMVRIARDAGVALVFSDAADWPYTEELTAGFVYLRLHGSEKTYASRYDDPALDRLAHAIRQWSRGRQPGDAERITGRKPPSRKSRDVYCYFDNDEKVHAPRDARRLMERLDIQWMEEREG